MRTAREPQWTPRQREVLDLLLRGHTNTQIAERLGISLDGAKWHVSEIITRLGVDSRDEAAEYWRAHNGLRLRFSRMVHGLFSSGVLKWGAATAFVGGAVVASVMVVVALRETGGDETDRSAGNPPNGDVTQPDTTQPNPAPTTVAGPVFTGETINGVQVQKLTFTTPGGFGQPMSAIIEKGCWGCDGPTEAIERVSLEISGQTRTEQLFRPASGYISSSYFDPAGKQHYLTVCSRGYCGGVGQISADAQTTIYRSLDGGVTWQALETTDGGVRVVANTQQGPLLSASFPTEGSGPAEPQFRLLGSTAVIRPPAGMEPAYDSLGNQLIGWRSSDGRTLLRMDGSRLLTIPDLSQLFAPDSRVRILGVHDNGDAVVAWEGEGPQSYTGVFESGKLKSVFVGAATLALGGWNTNFGFGNVRLPANGSTTGTPLYPAVIDFATGQVQVLELYGPVGSDAYAGQRNYVRWVSSGRNFRVKATGDCLNVRESPSTGAKSLGCFVDGVLLGDVAGSDGEEQAGGITWWKVATPGGEQGWASSEFLEGSQLRP